jgi:pSer/pThr/pTyr-binding forkhead associated (FHA) protein
MAADSAGYQLLITDDEGQVTTVPMLRDEFTVGRKEGNVIRLTERNVSRSHARLHRENGRFYLTDLGSYNGTRLNGRRIRGKMPLSPGDEIGIGDYVLRIEMSEGEAVAPAPPVEALKAPQLTVVTNGIPGTVYELTDIPHVIGRGEEATIRIDDAAVSRVHARLSLLQGRYFVEDASSANGILVAGRRVRSKALDPGDVIDLGRVHLYFTLGALLAEQIRPPEAPPRPPSRLPMIFGLIGLGVAVVGVVFLILNRGGRGGAGGAAPGAVAAAADEGTPRLVTPPEATSVVALVPDAEAAAPPSPPDDALRPADAAPPGPSAEEALAAARTAAETAGSVDDWEKVLALLDAVSLGASHEAAMLRADATRHRDARKAVDDALVALRRGAPAEAATLLAAVPPDARCAADAEAAWGKVIAAGREAGRAHRVDDLKRIVEALRVVMAPPPAVARGREELVAVLRRLDGGDAGGGPADAGTGWVRVGADAGPATQDTRARPDPGVTAPPRDAGTPPPPPPDDPYLRARQLAVANDQAGCARVLETAPRTERNMALLVMCLQGAGRANEARSAMQEYLDRFPDGPKAEDYRRRLGQ